MKKGKIWFLLSLTLFCLIFVCALSEKAQPAANPGWETDWKKTLDAAKKEGKVNIYSVASSSVRTDLTKAFLQKYGLQLEFVTGRGAEFI